ncbi:hypothetical protein LCM10_05960 [Rossellomorea aquimaris]|uniref:hypothetical protein n=1 Tax=Rossellomorea aquimaris TaxID=189382 RepID=UPI001CD7657E|nr:hypothetical protein [Rossellomorea aquimaris]MCA1054525.1 hypothetical protein [Rossellomorea aquimaris]
MPTFIKKGRSTLKELENGEGKITAWMQWILRTILISFLLISVPLFLYIMWIIPSL